MPPRLATKTGSLSGKQEGRARRTNAPKRRVAKKRPEAKESHKAKGGRKALRHRQKRIPRRSGQRRGRAVQGVPDDVEVSNGSACPICQETYCPAKFPVVHAPCGHVACAPCSLTWQKKKSSRTCALCRSPVLSIAHCGQLEQLLVPRPAAGEEDQDMSGASSSAGWGSGPGDQEALGAAASSSQDQEAVRAEVKKELQDLSQGDLNFIPGDYRAHLVRVAAHRAVLKGDLTMLETCLRNFKARVSTRLVCEVAGLWKKEPLPVISLLLAHGARLDGHAENRPLLHAVYCGNTRMAEGLLEMKADPAKTADGESALHVAVRRGRSDAVTMLLDRGMQTDVPDPAGRTPHFLAEMGWRVHQMACPRSPCHRCKERWAIRVKFADLAGGVPPAPRLMIEPTDQQGAEGPETESEDSSSDWEQSQSDVSDIDDWASEDDDEDEEEDDDNDEDESESEEEDEAAFVTLR